MPRALPCLLLATTLLAACDGGAAVPADTHTGTSGATTPTVTPPEGGWFDVTHMAWSAQFAYDASTRRTVPLEVPGFGALPPTLDVVLAGPAFEASGYDFSREDLYCLVSLYLADDATAPDWVAADPDLWFGVDHGSGAGGVTGCNTGSFLLDPAVWGTDPVATIGQLPGGWGVAVGALGEQAATEYVETLPETVRPYYFGGRMRVPYESVGETDSVVTLAYAIDPVTFERLADEEGFPIPLETIADADGLASGWYNTFDYYVYAL
ncbi:MAG: hypothetical protein H6738_02095 [Alphaproteobacteria bacterium]|nr:hypothetical protein [Alphaproteobacteria bacterium]MCB9695560.1 hypothetical protein [Alphaproteobacteria bacterium]